MAAAAAGVGLLGVGSDRDALRSTRDAPRSAFDAPRGNPGPGSVIAAKYPGLPARLTGDRPDTEGLGSVRAVGVTHAGGFVADRWRIGTSHRASAATTSNAAASGHQGATGGSASTVESPDCPDDARGNPAADASGMNELPPGLDGRIVGLGAASAAAIVAATGVEGATAVMEMTGSMAPAFGWVARSPAAGWVSILRCASNGLAPAEGAVATATGCVSALRCASDGFAPADGGSSSSTSRSPNQTSVKNCCRRPRRR